MRALSVFEHFGVKPDKTLYHYTSLDAFKAIVENGELWASDLRYLNDSREYRFLLEKIKERIEEVPDGMKMDLLKFQLPLHRLLSATTRSTFVVSFTECRDDLSQWRGYCSPGLGICIGFNHEWLIEKARASVIDQPTDLVKNGFTQFARVEYINKKDASTFDAFLEKSSDKTLGIGDLSSVEVLSVIMSIYAPFYKSDSFKSEQEWRIAKGFATAEQEPSPLLFRVAKSTLVPYTLFDLGSKSAEYISEVVIGPSPSARLTFEAVKRFLKAIGRADIPVEESAVPYRHW